MTFKIMQGDNRDLLKTIESNSIDAIVTDPPYGIDFLGKAWDANTGALETYQECLRVLKPGGHILAFSAARTYHHLAVTLEQAGFEIRDQLMWIYSSGFPKSQDIGRTIQRRLGVKKTKAIKNTTLRSKQLMNELSGDNVNLYANGEKQVVCTDPEAKQWSGWGTALKPAHEPIALARKPMKTSIAKNAQKWGVGALNIDATRIDTTDKIQNHYNRNGGSPEFAGEEHIDVEVDLTYSDKGRFPSNVLGEIQEEYQKYFYCPKVSRAERHMGHSAEITRTEMIEKMGGYWANERGEPKQEGEDGKMCWTPDTGLIYAHGITQEYAKWCKANNISAGNVGNNHPTVKPVELMKYLIKLVTPPGGTVLDPFCGSGSTGMAAVELGHDFVGCELDPNYVKIAEKRIQAWQQKDATENNFEALFDET